MKQYILIAVLLFLNIALLAQYTPIVKEEPIEHTFLSIRLQ